MNSIFLAPGEGRAYPMGRISAVFKADNDQYSISEWWLEPNTQGPGAHVHEKEDCVFYVIEGTMSILVGERWIEAIPGGFEKDMPAIARWFAENPPGNAA